MTVPMPDERTAYEAIKNMKEKFGTFHKSCFHIHTPASYDYSLLNNWSDKDYRKASDQEIFDICIKRKVFPDILTLDSITLDAARSCYNNKKEMLSYMLLAEMIIANDIEVVLVSDHHTVNGVGKLKTAINELCKMRKRNVYPEVLLGIEISCADTNHVVGMFEDSQTTIDKLNSWLTDNLISVEAGTFETSIRVLEFIKSINGIGYLAHLDTSKIFKEKFSSGAYKKKLFSDKVLQLVGLSDYKKLDVIKSHIQEFRSTEFKVVVDNDAHDVDTISDKVFWIKGSKRNYTMVKEALNDYDISVSFENERSAKQYKRHICSKQRERISKGQWQQWLLLKFF